ncbi:Bifunctional enzyme IspD/IspF [Candidatus Ecksteinia adelgidicola]|nr:Bifunctional enzyme IspD/IspF [Candidatus Ecksteinia adelgidicola]
MNNFSMPSQSVIAILPAAGIGKRMQSRCPKQYLNIGQYSILEHTIHALFSHPRIKQIIVAINFKDQYFKKLPILNDPRVIITFGGKKRIDTVLASMKLVKNTEWVLIHDAVRPCLHIQDLTRLLEITKYSKIGGILATPVCDTIKHSQPYLSTISHTIDRKNLWHALTPQLFPLTLLTCCLQRIIKENATITDEASALEYCGYYPLLINGRSDNIKITKPEDLMLATFYFNQFKKNKEYTMRIGHGFDVHSFGGNKPLIISGVHIPYKHGLVAHSDGDVVLHGVIDALLGSVGLGDIGQFFPDTDPAFKNANSRKLLHKAWTFIVNKGYRLNNIDITIILQIPIITQYIPNMRYLLSEDLKTDIDCINIKATTTEKLGFIGRKEGIACQVIALLIKV